ncbi:DUF998 domain-containing protein [Blastococcus sp. URHD0036]|uniref:DUF998 domain-containing protein n=1 Tax=Blastococcus sp. URHD0036 TaxID=1380356 RepID=UPI00054FDA30|nr:DUF998 domain-containing protein [Blastococcus sp. URHD0036]
MAAVTPLRLRLGALLWLLTLQFFVVEIVVQAQYELDYSRADDVISLLGSSVSPGHVLMNVSFVVQGVLVLAGLLLLRPALTGKGAQVATAMLAAAAIGVAVVGLFPLGDDDTWHRFGAFLYLAGSAIGLIGLAYAVRRRSEALGTFLALLGLVTTAMTVFYLTEVTGFLGEGGTERAAAYALPIGLAVAGIGLLRVAGRPVSDASTGRRAQREQERAERIRRARERDEALEAAAARTTPAEPAGAPAAEPAAGPADDGAADPADDFDPDDPWASPRRRRDG